METKADGIEDLRSKLMPLLIHAVALAIFSVIIFLGGNLTEVLIPKANQATIEHIETFLQVGIWSLFATEILCILGLRAATKVVEEFKHLVKATKSQPEIAHRATPSELMRQIGESSDEDH